MSTEHFAEALSKFRIKQT